MHLKFGLWCLVLYYLVLVLGINYVSIGAHSSILVQSFFTPNDLKEGNVIRTFFAPSKPSRFMSRELAESIPFSSAQLETVLDRFGISHNSPLAIAMAGSLSDCEHPNIKGETKMCATSLESMLDFVHHHFGPAHKFRPLFTRNVSRPTVRIQDFTIVGQPREVVAVDTAVACHRVTWPYTVYYCHYDVWGRRVFEVSLVGENGGQVVEAVAVCHVDTSVWDPNHTAFSDMGIKHGSPACHFFPDGHLLWVPLSSSVQQE